MYKKKIKKLILGTSQSDGSTAFFKKKVGGKEFNYYQYEIVNNQTTKNNNNFEVSFSYKLKNIIINFLPKYLLMYILKKKRFNEKIF